MEWYIDAFRNWDDFGGRATRKEYWLFVLFNLIVTWALTFVDAVMGIFVLGGFIGLFSGIYGLVVFIPSLAVTIRRLHDTGRSGWWIFINLLPIIGLIIFLVFMVQGSQSSSNAYGAHPQTA